MIDIQVFAGLKDFFPPKFQCTTPATIVELKNQLQTQHPASTDLLALCRFAVNEQFVSLDHPLHPYDRVAILPPASGG